MVYRTIWQNLKAWSDHEQEPATFAPLAIVFPQDIQFFLFCSSRHQSGVIHHIKHDTWQSINPQGQMCDVHSHQGIYLQAGWTGTSKEWLETAFFIFRNSGLETYKEKGSFGWNMLRDGSKHRWSSTQSGHAKPETLESSRSLAPGKNFCCLPNRWCQPYLINHWAV